MGAAAAWDEGGAGDAAGHLGGHRPVHRLGEKVPGVAAFGRQAGGSASFSDVPNRYAQAVSWAVDNGITNGTGGGRFSPDLVCDRGTIVTFLHRAFVEEVRLK